MLNNVQNSISRGEIVKWLICAILTLACLVVPEQGIYTTEVKLFLTVTVFGLSLAAFELVPTFFIAIVMPALWLILKVAPASVVMSPWVGTTMPMLVGAFFLGATLEDCGILRRIAFFLMCKVKGSYLY